MSWTDERVEILKKLWIDGLSASQIAKQLGGVTRNAVIGKVHRLGLAGRATPFRPIKRVARPRPVIAAVSSPSLEVEKDLGEELTKPILQTARPIYQQPINKIEPKRKENGSLISVLELTPTMCKWPIGDPTDADFGFCGAKAHGSWPYCAEHGAVAYQPASAKRGGGQASVAPQNSAVRKAV
ncbi:MAG: GcrA cell cycle regulator [Hyphomonadaceae bacterium]|nr:MAG: GcrA cell cycle regulator [Hyphomonadaceae bacterium]KAF0183550.1 MAG: GcrA cell cycle regulator [Hyphomonadaceae bacterium]